MSAGSATRTLPLFFFCSFSMIICLKTCPHKPVNAKNVISYVTCSFFSVRIVLTFSTFSAVNSAVKNVVSVPQKIESSFLFYRLFYFEIGWISSNNSTIVLSKKYFSKNSAIEGKILARIFKDIKVSSCSFNAKKIVFKVSEKFDNWTLKMFHPY